MNLSESAFSAITTQQSVHALWAGATPLTGGGDTVAMGSTYIVNTNQAKKVLIRVTTLTAGDPGTLTIKGSR